MIGVKVSTCCYEETTQLRVKADTLSPEIMGDLCISNY